MGIHLVNQELDAELATQRRHSTFVSIMLSLLIMSLLALSFKRVAIKIFSQQVVPITTYVSNDLVKEIVEVEKVTKVLPQKSLATPLPPSAVTAIITDTHSSFAIPLPEMDVASLDLDFGEADLNGWGNEHGSNFGESGFGASEKFGEGRVKPSV